MNQKKYFIITIIVAISLVPITVYWNDIFDCLLKRTPDTYIMLNQMKHSYTIEQIKEKSPVRAKIIFSPIKIPGVNNKNCEKQVIKFFDWNYLSNHSLQMLTIHNKGNGFDKNVIVDIGFNRKNTYIKLINIYNEKRVELVEGGKGSNYAVFECKQLIPGEKERVDIITYGNEINCLDVGSEKQFDINNICAFEVSIKPDDEYKFYQLGMLCLDNHDYDNAIEYFNIFLKQNTKDVRGYNHRGVSYYYSNDLEKALADFTKALNIKPQYVDALSNRAAVFLSMKLPHSAIQDCDDAIKEDPQFLDAYNNRGNAYVDIGKFDKAISDYSKALEINANDANSYYNRGCIYGKIGKYDDSISDFTMVLKITPNDDTVYIARAKSYACNNNYRDAINDLNTALKINPQSFETLNNLSYILSTCPDYKYRNGLKAINLAQKALLIKSHPMILDTLASAYAESGDFENAIITEKEAIQEAKKADYEYIKEMTIRLKSYENNKPWREKYYCKNQEYLLIKK